MSAPVDIPSRESATSPPIDPSKLNNTPAVIPLSPSNSHSQSLSQSSEAAPPLRSSDAETPYLDTGITEPASHPTVAETGVMSESPGQEKGPVKGQLKKVEGGEKKDGIISLGSFGGEGLMAKPSRSPSISMEAGQSGTAS
jgi:hypothetical protein